MILPKLSVLIALCCLTGLIFAFEAAAQEDEMPPQVAGQLERVLQEVRQRGIPENIRLLVRYTGEETVQGKPCYGLTVYADSPERYENVGMYAVSRDGNTLYRYDVAEDSYIRLNGELKK